MSRSRRKTPIFGHTTARSEVHDKRLWHKRWRSRERDQLATVGPDGEIMPIHGTWPRTASHGLAHAVSNWRQSAWPPGAAN